MQNNKRLSFGLRSIRELDYRIVNPYTLFPKRNLSNDQFDFNIKIEYKWDLEKDLFGIVFKTNIMLKEDIEKNHLLKLDLLYDFKVHNLKDFLKVESKKYFEMNEFLESSLVNIAISTTRGILFEKTKGEIFNQMMIPIVDPKSFMLSPKLKRNE